MPAILRWSLVVIVALVSLCAGAWWWLHDRGSSPLRTAAVATGAERESVAPAPSAAAAADDPAVAALAVANDDTSQTAPRPLPEGAIADIYDELRARAEAGDGAAAHRLAETMLLCRRYKPKSREETDEAIVEFGARVEDGEDKSWMSRDTLVGLLLSAADQQASRCIGFAGLGIDDPDAARLDWLARAVAARHPAAMVEQAQILLQTHSRREEIIQNAEEVRVLRAQATTLLQDAVATGEPRALLRAANAHFSGDLLPRDRVAAYAYMLAYHAGDPAPGAPASMIAAADRRFSDGLDAR